MAAARSQEPEMSKLLKSFTNLQVYTFQSTWEIYVCNWEFAVGWKTVKPARSSEKCKDLGRLFIRCESFWVVKTCRWMLPRDRSEIVHSDRWYTFWKKESMSASSNFILRNSIRYVNYKQFMFATEERNLYKFTRPSLWRMFKSISL